MPLVVWNVNPGTLHVETDLLPGYVSSSLDTMTVETGPAFYEINGLVYVDHDLYAETYPVASPSSTFRPLSIKVRRLAASTSLPSYSRLIEAARTFSPVSSSITRIPRSAGVILRSLSPSSLETLLDPTFIYQRVIEAVSSSQVTRHRALARRISFSSVSSLLTRVNWNTFVTLPSVSTSLAMMKSGGDYIMVMLARSGSDSSTGHNPSKILRAASSSAVSIFWRWANWMMGRLGS